VADQFAANGYLVVAPDLFQGDPIPPNRGADFDMLTWRGKHGTETVDPIVDGVIKELRTKYGVKKIGTAGYCFGARPAVRFLKKGVTEAAYVAHPSWVQAEEVREIQGPLAIAAAGKGLYDHSCAWRY
jgi:dienelactone hydrolase